MHDVGSPLYLPLRLLHILGAMLFLGALVTGLLLKLGADRSGDPAFAARLHRQLRRIDASVIGPAGVVIFASGYGMVRFLGGRILDHAFVLVGLITLTLALGLWYFGIRLMGQKLAEEADASVANRQALSADYARTSAGWVIAASLAIALVVATAIIMVFRLPSG